MQRLSQFIVSAENQRYLRPKLKVIAQEVKKVIDEGIISKLNSLSVDLPPTEFDEKANVVFQDILTATSYEEDSRLLISRLNLLINTIVSETTLELYHNGDKDVIYALASSDVVKEMQSFAGHEKATVDMITDAQKTKGQVIGLFEAFVDAFQDPIKRSLEELNKPENLKRRAIERGHLCLQLLGLNETFDKKFKEKTILKYCEGPPCRLSPALLHRPPSLK